jgi:hypothetical protein
LTLNAGSGAVALGVLGRTADGQTGVPLAAVTITGTGTNTLAGNISSTGNVNLGTGRATSITSSLTIGSGSGAMTLGDLTLANGISLVLGDAGLPVKVVAPQMSHSVIAAPLTLAVTSKLGLAPSGLTRLLATLLLRVQLRSHSSEPMVVLPITLA